MIQHIIPTNEEHNESVWEFNDVDSDRPIVSDCICEPDIKEDGSGGWLILHNSFDGREGVEIVNKILNMAKKITINGKQTDLTEKEEKIYRKGWNDAMTIATVAILIFDTILLFVLIHYLK